MSCDITMVELRGLEPLTFSLRTRRATSCAIAPRTSGPDQHRDLTTVRLRQTLAILRLRRPHWKGRRQRPGRLP